MSDSSSSRSPLQAANHNHLWAQLLIEELVRSGVDTFLLAPGSRSTPLTTAVARHPSAHAVIHYDERGTAFAALGYGRATGRPAGWITTSGTAVANGLPAVVEAAMEGVPLLLLTADRPPELRETGANQTIDQVKLFGDYVRWQFDLPTPTRDIDPAMVLTTADQAVHRARRPPAGPVHLNCMFRKPLAPEPDGHDDRTYTAGLAAWAEASTPYTRYPIPAPAPAGREIESVAAIVRAAECGLLIAGRLDTDAERRAVRSLAEHLHWPLLPDITSGLRLGTEGPSGRIAYADQVLSSAAFRTAMPPDVVVHVGGRFVSKRLRHYLAAARPAHRLVVRPDPARFDPDHRVTRHIESAIEPFCAALTAQEALSSASGSWRRRWQAADAAVREQVEQFMAEDEALTEPRVAHQLAEHIPPDHALVLASSMPVRDMNRYGAVRGPTVPALANRGASGIDGTVATAAGVVQGRGAPATLLIGDLALLHDLNALALLRDQPVIVVAVNNSGGGIFHFLPIAEHDDVFEPYFTTPHPWSFEQAAACFELPYAQPTTVEGFVSAYRAACERGTSALIEVTTDRADNRAVHDALEQRVARAVQRTVEAE